MKKTKKEIEIKEIPATANSIAPLFSNIPAVYTHEEMVVLDFGFLAPPYIENADYLEDTQIARLCLPWSAIEELHRMLSDALEKHSGKKNKKKTITSKS